MEIMNKRYIVLLLSLIIINNLPSQTQVYLWECRKDAVEFNKSLDMARMDVRYANAAVKAARTAYLPKVSGTGSMMYMPEIDDFSIPGFFLPTAENSEAASMGNYSGTSDVYFPGFQMDMSVIKLYMAELSVEQPIYAGGQVRLANKKAQKGLELAQQALNLKQSEIIFGVDRTFWSLVAIQEQSVAINRYIIALDSLASDLSSYYTLNLIPKSELLKVKVQLDEAKIKQLEVDNMLKITSMNLALLTGRKLDVFLLAVPGSIGADNGNNFNKNLDFSSRPELKILEYQKDLAGLDKKSVKGEYLPQIGLNVGYQYIKVANLYDGGWNFSAGAGVSIPLIHWREKKYRTNMAHIKFLKTEAELSGYRDKVNLEVQQSLLNLETGLEKVELAKDNLTQAEETLSEVKLSFEGGINSITDLLTAQASHQRAIANLTEARANLEILKSAYLKSIGLLTN